VPIASDIASASSSDLLFSEPPTITVPTPEVAPAGVPIPPATEPASQPVDPTQEYLDQLLQRGAHATLLEAAEICAALGGVYLRIVWDPAVRDRPWLTAVHPDVAVPEWTVGRPRRGHVLAESSPEGQDRRPAPRTPRAREDPPRRLRGHRRRAGPPVVPLTEYPETAGLANNQLTDGNDRPTGATGLTAAYVPNMRPNRLWRNQPGRRPPRPLRLRRRRALMDALDMTYSSLDARRRPGQGPPDRPASTSSPTGPGKGARGPRPGAVRADQHDGPEDGSSQITRSSSPSGSTTARPGAELKTTIVTAAGYSADVRPHRRSRGHRHRGRGQGTPVLHHPRPKDRYWRPKLADILLAYLEVAAYWFKPAGVVPVRPDVEWADSVSIDPVALAQELNLLEQAKAISTEQKVRRLNPTWGNTEVAAEVQKITDETAAPVPDPTTFTGGGGFDQQQGTPA
jgi:hypothetical protein